MELPSPLALKNRSNSLPEVILMIPNVASHAVKQGNRGIMEMVATGVMATTHLEKCSMRYVHSAARIPGYLSSHARADRYIAAIAITRLDQPGRTG